MSLLDDVSIVVTPNGYKAGELYAVIPVPTEGAEEITNGDFATDTDWSKGTGWTISGGTANCDGTGGSSIYQDISGVQNTRYAITLTISDYTSGTLQIGGSTNNLEVNSNGTFTHYRTWASDTMLYLKSKSGDGFNGSIDNVSVKEYTSADMDVTRATAATRVDENGLVNYALGVEEVTNGDFSNGSTDWGTTLGWSIADNKASNDGTGGILRQVGAVPLNTKFKVVFTVDDYVTGNIQIKLAPVGQSIVITGDGTYTIYTDGNNSANGDLQIIATSSFQGSVTNISVKQVDNVPRIDYTGGGCPHILAEPQRTNEITYSEDFSQSFWNQTTADVNVTTNTNPSGTSGTYSVERVTGSQLGASFTVTSGNDYTASWYVRNISGTGAIIIKDTNNSTNNFTATSEWQRFSVTATASSATGRCYIQVPTVNDEIEVWGAQFEEGSYATSYIPTSGSAVTRNQDIFTRDGIGSLINSTEGVLYWEGSTLINGGGDNRIISLSDGTNNNLIYIRIDSTASRFRGYARGSSGSYTLVTVNSIPQTDNNKIALVWDATNFIIWINGSKRSTTTINNSPVGMNTLNLSSPTGSDTFFGKVKQLQVYDTALTDEQLLQLTGESGTDFYESYAEMASALTYTIQ